MFRLPEPALDAAETLVPELIEAAYPDGAHNAEALFLIGGRIERMDRPTGLADEELVRVRATSIGPNENRDAQAKVDLDALRAIPGVKSVAITNQIPFDGSSWNTSRGSR